MNGFRNIVVLKWGALGDFIAGTVAIRALREHLPDARITLFTNPNGIEIAPPGSIVDAAIDRKAVTAAHGSFGLLRELRRQRFDLAVNLKWSSEGAILLSRIAAPKVAGGGTHWLRWLYAYQAPLTPEGIWRHEYHKNRDIVEAFGVPPGEPRAYLHAEAADLEFAGDYFARHGLAGVPTLLIAPGASRPGKMWPADRYAEIGRRFAARVGGRILISWGPRDEPVAREVAAGIGAAALLLPRTSVRQIGALVRRADLCMCNNSGMLHVAYAVEKPVVCLNTTVSWMPYGPRSFAVNAFAAEHLARQPGLGGQTAPRLLRDIPVDEVWHTLTDRALPAAGLAPRQAEPVERTQQ